MLQAATIALRRIYLSYPPGVSITGGSHPDLRVEVAELEFLNVCLRVMEHALNFSQRGYDSIPEINNTLTFLQEIRSVSSQ